MSGDHNWIGLQPVPDRSPLLRSTPFGAVFTASPHESSPPLTSSRSARLCQRLRGASDRDREGLRRFRLRLRVGPGLGLLLGFRSRLGEECLRPGALVREEVAHVGRRANCRRGIRTGNPALPFCSLRLRAPKPIDKAYPTELRTIGDHIRKRRLDFGLLQREVALRIGVDKSTVFNWEAGTAKPNRRALSGVIAFLGYDPTETRSTIGERIPAARRAPGGDPLRSWRLRSP